MLILDVTNPDACPSFQIITDACDLAKRIQVNIRVTVLNKTVVVSPDDVSHILYKKHFELS